MISNNAFSIDINRLKKSIDSVINGHKTLAQLNNIDEEALVNIYKDALDKYYSGNMAEAITHFTYLVMNNPWRREYIFGLASTLHALEQFENALIFYGYATLMDACDAGVTFRIGQCYLLLDRTNEASDALRTSIKQSFLSPEQPEIRQLAQSLLDEIHQYNQ
ncbi:type III secretion protein [Vibrio sp. Of14-4]|uniref:Type III secretion protein n=1 Tax=Vibrio tetraodonis subsp. pristinus TaxID=2695891 RepID=A0A6L8LRB2_9VIBR|nr:MULTISPECIES: tetratricopeptide repeat protein [Vibrio]MCG7490144.1 type III secretion protein [Vibrio sp. Of14-4]MYM58558.1 type III secretion protein [Vibrio tetraodonis subsp. pristinus]